MCSTAVQTYKIVQQEGVLIVEKCRLLGKPCIGSKTTVVILLIND